MGIFEMNENTYWNSKGKYQKEYDVISESIPTQGECKGKLAFLEPVRLMANVYYDLYNNGGGNTAVGWLRHDQLLELEQYLTKGMYFLWRKLVDFWNEEQSCDTCGGYGYYIDDWYDDEEDEWVNEESNCYDCSGKGLITRGMIDDFNDPICQVYEELTDLIILEGYSRFNQENF